MNEKEILQNLYVSFQNLKKSWKESGNLLNNLQDCNKYILCNQEGKTVYPFDKSFDEIDFEKWMDSCLENIEKEI